MSITLEICLESGSLRRSTNTMRPGSRLGQAMLELMEMQEAAVTAVERIFYAQADVGTAQILIKQKQKPGAGEDEDLKALGEKAGKIQKALVELEKRFRTPPRTKGIVYDDDQVSSKINMAMYYVGSTADVPTATANRPRRRTEEIENAAARIITTTVACQRSGT